MSVKYVEVPALAEVFTTLGVPQVWLGIVERTSVGGSMPVALSFYLGAVVFEMAVNDVNTGRPVRLRRVQMRPDLTDEWEILMWLRDQVRWLYLHEVDEQLRVDGAPVVDPDWDHE